MKLNAKEQELLGLTIELGEFANTALMNVELLRPVIERNERMLAKVREDEKDNDRGRLPEPIQAKLKANAQKTLEASDRMAEEIFGLKIRRETELKQYLGDPEIDGRVLNDYLDAVRQANAALDEHLELIVRNNRVDNGFLSLLP